MSARLLGRRPAPARLSRCFLTLGTLLLLGTLSAQSEDAQGERSKPEIPGRDAILEVARSYSNHVWHASESNTLHGPDADGIHVDTPDVSHRSDGFRTDGSPNIGVPYKWGGFTSLVEFDAAVAAGQPAGQLTDGVNLDASRHAVGVDCSGFVARCWNLPFKQSTRSLGRLCFELSSYDELKVGDLLNKFDAHAMLFVEFTGDDSERVTVIEAAFPNVKQSTYPRSTLESNGFLPYRYKPLDGRWHTPTRAPVTERFPIGSGQWVANGQVERFEAERVLPGLDLRSVLDGSLEDGLATARAGEWVAYAVGNIDGPAAMDVQRVVSKLEDGAVQVQTSTGLGAQIMGTSESHATLGTVVGRLLALEDSGPPLNALRVVSGSVTPGHWQHGETTLHGHRLELVLAGAMTSRSNDLALDIRLKAVLSPEVPLEGIIHWQRETRYELPSGEALSTMSYQLRAFGWDSIRQD